MQKIKFFLENDVTKPPLSVLNRQKEVFKMKTRKIIAIMAALLMAVTATGCDNEIGRL